MIERATTWVLLEVSGMGYRVYVSPAVLSALRGEGETFLYVHEQVREDADDLYGFLSLADLELFERLLTISGVGPKVAMTLLSVGSADTVRGAIMKGDLALLTSVPGVGTKTAQKIVLELKGQLVEAGHDAPQDRDVIEALQSLGYSIQQAREALKAVSSDIVETSARVREALRFLGK